MFLSRVKLDIHKRETMVALSRVTRLHAVVEASCGDDNQRKLWRLDSLGGELYLLMLSAVKPNLYDLEQQFGYSDERAEARSVDYDRLLDRVQVGSSWHFRLVANPVHSSKGDRCVRYPQHNKAGNIIQTVNVAQKERGKICGHVTSEQQEEWLLKRSANNGFSLIAGQYSVVGSKWNKFAKRDGNTVSQLAVAFEGILTVTDADLFKNALVNGIGKGKAYGLGMMTISKG